MSRNSKKMETLPLPTLLSTPLKCCRRFSSEDEDLEQALRNYERYHKLPVGTATLAQLKSSSAGVSGWVDYHGSDDGNGSKKKESKITYIKVILLDKIYNVKTFAITKKR